MQSFRLSRSEGVLRVSPDGLLSGCFVCVYAHPGAASRWYDHSGGGEVVAVWIFCVNWGDRGRGRATHMGDSLVQLHR